MTTTIGSGIGAIVGMAPETAYGTWQAPTRFSQVQKAPVKKVKNTQQGGGIAGGTFLQPGSRRVVTTQAAAGSIDQEVTNKGMGLWLQQVFGGTVTPQQQGATTAYLQTWPFANNLGTSHSLQIGLPDRAGVQHAYSYEGGKVTAAEFSCGVDGLLVVSLTVDYRDVVETQTLATAAYPAGLLPFHFGQMSLKMGNFGAEAPVNGVKKVSLKIERVQDTGAFYANGGGKKAEPVMSDFIKLTGSIDADFVNKADFADRFASDGSSSLVWNFTGNLIASTYYETFELDVPMVFLDTDTPSLDGNGPISGTFNFTGLWDESHAPVTAKYMSADLAL